MSLAGTNRQTRKSFIDRRYAIIHSYFKSFIAKDIGIYNGRSSSKLEKRSQKELSWHKWIGLENGQEFMTPNDLIWCNKTDFSVKTTLFGWRGEKDCKLSESHAINSCSSMRNSTEEETTADEDYTLDRQHKWGYDKTRPNIWQRHFIWQMRERIINGNRLFGPNGWRHELLVNCWWWESTRDLNDNINVLKTKWRAQRVSLACQFWSIIIWIMRDECSLFLTSDVSDLVMVREVVALLCPCCCERFSLKNCCF